MRFECNSTERLIPDKTATVIENSTGFGLRVKSGNRSRERVGYATEEGSQDYLFGAYNWISLGNPN